jgi:hypothetical protein
MKRIVIVFIVFFMVIASVDAQVIYPVETDTLKTKNELNDSINKKVDEAEKIDILYQHNGTTTEVNFKRIYLNDLYYSLPGETKVNKIDQRLVHKIAYKNGKLEILNEKAPDVRAVGDYRKVKVTKDSDEVEGLVEVARLEAKAEGNGKGNTTLKTLERTATIVLRRKAALVNADIVLITGKRSNTAFGETPSYTLLGIAYSYR